MASRPSARAYRVHAVDGAAVEEAIEPRLLKSQAHADPTAPLAVEEMRALHAVAARLPPRLSGARRSGRARGGGGGGPRADPARRQAAAATRRRDAARRRAAFGVTRPDRNAPVADSSSAATSSGVPAAIR